MGRVIGQLQLFVELSLFTTGQGAGESARLKGFRATCGGG